MGMSLVQPPPHDHQRSSGCKRQAVAEMRCCPEDLPQACWNRKFPAWPCHGSIH